MSLLRQQLRKAMTRSESESIVVQDAPDQSRFEILVDGERAGIAQYGRRGGRFVFVHTEIDPKFEGRGLGSKLAARALDHVRGAGELVVPLCPFIGSYISRHPEYDDIVDHQLLARFDEDPS
jgi:predicted GNAT family acetyltransferase